MIKAEGIIIRTTDYGETNKIVTLFTEEYGKIGLMARGAKKPRSPLSSVSHVLFYGLCLLQKGRGLGMLYQAEGLNPLRHIMEDIEKAGYAAVMLELTDRLTEEGKAYSGLYHMLRDTLLLMEKGTDAAVLAAIFAVKMMRIAGIDPEVDRCIRCGRQSEQVRFSVSGGGILCSGCAGADPHAIPVSVPAAKLLSLFKHIPIARIGHVSLKRKTIEEIESLIAVYYEQNAGLKLRAWRFIEQLSRFRTE